MKYIEAKEKQLYEVGWRLRNRKSRDRKRRTVLITPKKKEWLLKLSIKQ